MRRLAQAAAAWPTKESSSALIMADALVAADGRADEDIDRTCSSPLTGEKLLRPPATVVFDLIGGPA
jgi:hypothetical protein